MKISVLMPVYNEEQFIEAAVDSLAKQSGDWALEVVVVDDFSTDRTLEKLRELSNRYSFLKIVKGIEKGKNNAFNLAFESSSGDLVVLFAGDDLMPEDALEKRAAALLDKKERMAASLCKMEVFSERGAFKSFVTPRDPDKGALSGGAMMLTRKLAERVFPLPKVLANEDMWVACHLNYLSDVDVEHVPSVGLRYRIHDDNSATREKDFEKKTESMHVRYVVYGFFLERYRGMLRKEEEDKLAALSAAETLRYQRDTFSLLCMSGLSLVERARFAFYSKAFLYWIRLRFFGFFSGR